MDRALQALPDLASRRAVLREKIAGAPAAGIRAIDAIVRRALGGSASGPDAAVALASTLIGLRRVGEVAILDALRAEAVRADLPAVAALLADAPAHRALAPRGRLREVCIPERAPFRRWSLAFERSAGHAMLLQLRRERVAGRFAGHPSPVLVGRLLREPWLEVSDVLLVAARRPTTPALAFELAGHDCVFRPTRPPIPPAPGQPFQSTRARSERSDGIPLRSGLGAHLSQRGDAWMISPCLPSSLRALSTS